MAGANLKVRVGADVQDFLGQMRSLDTHFNRVTRSVNDHGFALSKTQRALESFASEAVGANRTLGVLSTVISDFAVGSVVTTGAILGIGAIALAYNQLTEAGKKAMEVSDKLIESYNKAARIRALGVGGAQKADIEDTNAGVGQYSKRAGVFGFLSTLTGGNSTGIGTYFGSLAEGYTKKVSDAGRAVQEMVNQVGTEVGKANDETARKAQEAADKVRAAWQKQQEEFKAGVRAALGVFDELQTNGVKSQTVNGALVSSYDRVAVKLRAMGDTASVARTEMLALQAALMGNILVAQHVAAINSTGTVGPLAGKTLPGPTLVSNGAIDDARNRLMNGPMSHVGGPSEVVHVETDNERQIRQDKENTDLLRNTISNTAAQTAGIIANALLRFGDSRAAQLGGAIGGSVGSGIGQYLGGKAGAALGGVIGAGVGSVIPVVGTLIGGFIGSSIGGLFGGHKKSVDNNTHAIEKLTAAMLANAPSGFKVETYRFAASDARPSSRRPNSPPRGGDTIIYGDVHVSGVQDIRDLGQQLRATTARGGANPLVLSAA